MHHLRSKSPFDSDTDPSRWHVGRTPIATRDQSKPRNSDIFGFVVDGGRQVVLLAALSLALMMTMSFGPARADFSLPFLVSEDHTSGNPRVAVDASGNAVMTWIRSLDEFENGDWKIQARRRSATGVLGPILTVAGSNYNVVYPRVAVNPVGQAMLAWASSDGTRFRIQARTLSATGVLGPIKTISRRGNAREPEVAIDANGNAAFIWEIPLPGGKQIQARTLSATGILGPLLRLSPANKYSSSARVGIDTDGDVIFSWAYFTGAFYSVQARTLSAAGVLGSVLTLSPAGQDTGPPELAVQPNGSAVFVWWADGEIQARRLFSTGALGPIKTISPSSPFNQLDSDVAVDRRGRAVFTWSFYNGTSYQVQARTLSARDVLGPMRAISQPDGYNAGTGMSPQVAVDIDGDAVITWVFHVDSTHSRAQARALSNAEVLGRLQNLSEPRLWDPPQVAVDADGDALAVWSVGDYVGFRLDNLRVQAAAGP